PAVAPFEGPVEGAHEAVDDGRPVPARQLGPARALGRPGGGLGLALGPLLVALGALFVALGGGEGREAPGGRLPFAVELAQDHILLVATVLQPSAVFSDLFGRVVQVADGGAGQFADPADE